MTYAKSLNKIEQAHKLYKTGYKPKEIAAQLKTPRPTIYRWLRVSDNIEINNYRNRTFTPVQLPTDNNDNYHNNKIDKINFRKEINKNQITDNFKNDNLFDDKLSYFKTKSLKFSLLIFCTMCTAFIIWESGKLQNSFETMLLSALIEIGAVMLAAAPLKGRQRYLKIFLLSVISIYSITLLCTGLLSKAEIEKIQFTNFQKNHEMRRDILNKKNDNIIKVINAISDQIESKKNELNGYIQSGYITFSKKISNEIKELEDKVINLNTQLSADIQVSDITLKPFNFNATILLCVGRALLVILNFMAASFYHKIKD